MESVRFFDLLHNQNLITRIASAQNKPWDIAAQPRQRLRGLNGITRHPNQNGGAIPIKKLGNCQVLNIDNIDSLAPRLLSFSMARLVECCLRCAVVKTESSPKAARVDTVYVHDKKHALRPSMAEKTSLKSLWRTIRLNSNHEHVCRKNWC